MCELRTFRATYELSLVFSVEEDGHTVEGGQTGGLLGYGKGVGVSTGAGFQGPQSVAVLGFSRAALRPVLPTVRVRIRKKWAPPA